MQGKKYCNTFALPEAKAWVKYRTEQNIYVWQYAFKLHIFLLLMIYRFRIVSDEAPGMRLEIKTSSDASFLQLRNAILDAAGYERSHNDCFYLCDEDWERRELIAMTDEDADSATDVWIMDETPLENLIEEEGQRLQFVFDRGKDRCLDIEMREMIFSSVLSEPVCTLRQGKAPAQVLKDPEPEKKPTVQTVEDLGLDFYGAEEFNPEELPEGFDEELD